MFNAQSTRRQFFTRFAGVMAAVGVGSLLTKTAAFAAEGRKKEAGAAAAGGGEKEVFAEPGKGMPGSVNYVLNHKDIKDASLKQERMGVPFEKQTCSGCAQFTKLGMKNGVEYGECKIFMSPKLLVKGTSWCSTWVKKS